MRLPSLLLTPLLALASAPQEWEPVSPDLELAFPADHGAHPRTRTEWWYLTGHLAAADGRRFGFQFTVFRRGLAPGPGNPGDSPLRARQVLAGHLAVTDVEDGRTLFAERLRRTGSPLARAARDDLDLVLEDWQLRRSPDDVLMLFASDAGLGIGLELELAPRKPLVFHGEGGYSVKGREPGNASAYVSWTRLATTGVLDLGSESLAVEGQAWFDHEFGNSFLEEGVLGWDWFGLQLEDGRELMLFALRGDDGERAFAAGTLIESSGEMRRLAASDFHVEELSTWTSPRTDATYPAHWRLTVPGADLELEVLPLVADCELVTTRSTGVAYWEGPVELKGTTGGRGYAELTGYAGSMEGRL